MKSLTTSRFWEAYYALPAQVRQAARKAYLLFLNNPAHPSLQFKSVHPSEPIYSVRISRSYRALGLVEDDQTSWFWIGNHDDYDRLIRTFD